MTELRAAIMANRRPFWLVAGASVAVNLLMLTSPIYMLQLYDRVLTSGSVQTLVLLTMIAVFLLGALAMLDAIRARVMTHIGSQFEARIKGRVFDSTLQRAVASGASAGSAQSMRDLDQIRQFLGSPAIFALFDSPFTPLFIILIFIMHPLLGVISLFGALTIFAIAYVTEQASRKEVRAAAGLSIASNNFLDAGLRNGDVLEAMGMGGNINDAWRKRHDPVVALQGQAANKVSGLLSLSKAFRFTLQVAILCAGGWLALQQIVSPGVMVAASIIMARALAPVEQAIGAWRTVIQVRAAYARLDQLLSTVPERHKGLDLPDPKGHLQIDNAVLMLPGQPDPLLKAISLSVKPGECHILVGPSGAGKSSLAKLAVGVIPATRGTIRLDGADIYTWHPAQRGRHIGYLPQDSGLFSGTVAENICRFDPDAAEEDILEAAKGAGVHDLILRLPKGYETPLGEGGANLSGGERQRIALARAIYGKPALLVLDEPNSNLDSDGERALAQAVMKAKSYGAGILMITHNVQLSKLAETLSVIRDGAIVETGPRQAILEKLRPANKQPAAPSQTVTSQESSTS